MNLYVPEIKDQLKLTKDWTFELHPEYRNETLGAWLKHYMSRGGWVDESVLPKMREKDYEVIYPPQPEYKTGIFANNRERYEAYNKACREAEKNNQEYQKWNKDFSEWLRQCDKVAKPAISVTIPKDTIIQVDRIYIRKGKSDYSSITFYAKNLGSVSVTNWYRSKTINKGIRFWAKLADCNTIEFEKV